MEVGKLTDWKGSNSSLYSEGDTSPPPQLDSSGRFSHFETEHAPSAEPKMPRPDLNTRSAQTQAQIDEVDDIMRANVDKEPERETKQPEDTTRHPSEGNRPIDSYSITKVLNVVLTILATPLIIVGAPIVCSVVFACGAGFMAHQWMTEHNKHCICVGVAAFGAGILGAIVGLVTGPFIAIIAECMSIKDTINETNTLREFYEQKLAEACNQREDTPNTPPAYP